MPRKSLLFALGLIILLLGLATTGVIVVLKTIPKYYQTLQMEDSVERKQKSGEFVSKVSDVLNDIENNESRWGVELSSDLLNSFFQQDFLESVGGEHYLPTGFYDPRVVIEDDKLKLGVRYGVGFWSAIITLEVRVWLVANEVNMIALEINNLKAGGMPLSPNVLLDYITEAARNANMSLTWYRHKGNPVAILRYQADQLVPTLIIQRLEFLDGKLAIAGTCTDAKRSRTVMKPLK